MAASLTTGMQKLQLQALAPKIAPGTKGIPTEIRTNSYKLMLRPNMPYYKYDVRMFELYPAKGEEGLKEKELCKQTRDDYTEQDRKTKTVQLLKQLCSQGKIKASLEELAYDRAAVLFSTKKLENEQTINFSPAELKAFRYEINDDCKGVKIVIKAVTEGFQLSSNDIIKAVSSRAVEQDRSILEFLNLVTSQQAFMGGNFVVYGSNAAYLYDHTQYGFTNQDVPALPEGKYMGIGGGKSVKILEGGDAKNPSPLVTIDVTKGAFHIDNQSAIEKIAAILNCKTSDLPNRIMSGRQIVTKGIKGLSFKTTYLGSKDRVFRCRGLGPVAKEAKFAVDGKEISVVAYFSQKYKKPIQYPQLPVLLSERGSFFPIELCVVAPNQRVAFANQTPAQIQVQIRACAVPPAIRMKQTHQVTGAMGLSAASDNKHLKAAGIVVDKEPVSVAARTLPLPKVRDGKNLPAIQGNCKWMVEKFITPATVPDWAIYGALSKYDSGNGLPVVENFAKTIVARGCQFGMRWGPPKELKLIDPFDLEPVFVNAEKAGLKFLMFVSSDNLTHHEFMKALELKYQILTQDVRFSKARDTSKVETIKNFVMKTNEKNGGLNYKIEDASAMLDKSILILGIEFSHPPPCPKGKEPTMPSVLGWSANCTANNQKWVGDYKFIKPRTADDRSELATPLKAIFSEAVGRFKSGRNAPPSLVMIYRNGVSEGQFGLLLEEEIPLFYDACSEMSGGKYKPELVVIAVGKDHVHRIYKKNPGNGRPAEQNIMPGTVVDKGIVSPVVNEFFLNSHSAFQGTAKTPKYTIIKNGTSKPALLSMDAIEQVTHALTYTHGIIGATISLPGVLKVAGEMAKRGAANYRSNYGESSSSGAGPANVETANAALTYSGKKLSAIRFNA